MSYKKKQLEVFTNLGTSPNEWDNMGLSYIAEEPTNCELCNHYPIIRVFRLHSKKLDKDLHVGSECVKNYITVAKNKSYKEYVNGLAYDEFYTWRNGFFTEYKHNTDHTNVEKNLAVDVYNINKDYIPNNEYIKHALGKHIYRIYGRAWKHGFSIPNTVHMYMVLEEKIK